MGGSKLFPAFSAWACRFRRKGIGESLVRQAVAARAFGLQRVDLTVREDNSGAIELYEKVGFEIEGRQRDAVHVDGAHENSICMALLF